MKKSMYQATINSSITISGICAHSGEHNSLSICCAPEDSGILYIRKDLEPGIDGKISANYKNVSDTTLCTKLSNAHGVSISLVEHLSAALYATGVTNAIVEIYGNEIPVLDGSATIFVEKILEAGILMQATKRKKMKILREVKIGDKHRWAAFSPSSSLSINVECDFVAKGLTTKPFSYNASNDNFAKDIAPARTFGFFADVEYLRTNNLARGASLDNVVVFDDNGNPINEEGLRYPDEPIRHKILDVIGDISLAGYEIIGNYNAFCPGHTLNNMLLIELFSSDANFETFE